MPGNSGCEALLGYIELILIVGVDGKEWPICLNPISNFGVTNEADAIIDHIPFCLSSATQKNGRFFLLRWHLQQQYNHHGTPL